MRELKGKLERVLGFCPVCGKATKSFNYDGEFRYVICMHEENEEAFKVVRLKQIPMELR